MAASGEHPNRKEGFGPGASAQQQEEAEEEAGAGEQLNGKAGSWRVGWPTPCIDDIAVCFFYSNQVPNPACWHPCGRGNSTISDA